MSYAHYSKCTGYGWFPRRMTYDLAESLWARRKKSRGGRVVWRWWVMEKRGDVFYFGPRGYTSAARICIRDAGGARVSLDRNNVATILSDSFYQSDLIRISQIIGVQTRFMAANFRRHACKVRMFYGNEYRPFRCGMQFNTMTGELLTPELLDDPKLYINRSVTAKFRNKYKWVAQVIPALVRLDDTLWDPYNLWSKVAEERERLLSLDVDNLTPMDFFNAIQTIDYWGLHNLKEGEENPERKAQRLVARAFRFFYPRIPGAFKEVMEPAN